MPTTNQTSRPLIFERRHYYAPYGHVTLQAQYNQPLTEQQLQVALKQLTSKYPLMSAHIKQNNDGAAYFVFDPTPQYQITVQKKIDDNQWLKIAMTEHKQPFNLNKGTLIKFIILNSPDSSDLIILCHHTICDGLSLTYLIRDLTGQFNHPNQPVTPKTPPPTVTPENFKAKTPTHILLKLQLTYTNWRWRKNKTVFDQDDYERIHQAYWNASQVQVELLTLPEPLTAAFLSSCHKQKVSVNSALVTAMAFAQNEAEGNNGSFSDNVGIAVNLRHLFKEPADEAFGLLASGTLMPVVYAGEETFWAVAKKVNDETKEMHANPKQVLEPLAFNNVDPTLVDARWFSAYGDFKNGITQRHRFFARSKRTQKCKLSVTNLGKVAIDDQGQLYKAKSLCFVPPYWPNNEKIIGIITAAGTMSISILYDSRYTQEEDIVQFRTLMLKYVEEAAQDTPSA
jgi:NRPS condensation-like uncharacterized protein